MSSVGLPELPSSWRAALRDELQKPYFAELTRFLAQERARHAIYPPEGEVFAALEHTSFEAVKVVLLGQDPYHGEGQAHGLCFSVRPGVKPPPSLVNVFKELSADLGVPLPKTGSLESWAGQGVLLLNTVLTVRAHQAHSHRRKGWEQFTDAVLRAVSAQPRPVVFLLWGGPAQSKQKLIDSARHTLLTSPHPSPLSAYAGFFGSRPFSKANAALAASGRGEIQWAAP